MLSVFFRKVVSQSIYHFLYVFVYSYVQGASNVFTLFGASITGIQSITPVMTNENKVDCSSQVFFIAIFFSFLFVQLPPFMHNCKVFLLYFQIKHQIFMGTIFSRAHVSTSWEVQWLFICRWKTRGFENASDDRWLFLRKRLYQQKGQVNFYIISGVFLNLINWF